MISALVGEREKMRAITGRNSMMQIWKLLLGLGIMMSVLASANDQPALAHQSCTGLAEWFDEEAITSKGRRAPNFEQARRIKREGVELCATGREGDAAALLITALNMIGVATADSASPSRLAERDCSQLVEIFDTEARGGAETRKVPNVVQARRIRREGNALCRSGQQAEANALLLTALRLIGRSDMPTDLQTVIVDRDCNSLLERLDEELGGGSNARNVPNAAQAKQLRSLARAHCKEGNREQANEVLVEAFRMIGRSVAL